MITLDQIKDMQRSSDDFAQSLWYEENVNGHRVVSVFPETEAYLADRVRDGKQFYMFATHHLPREKDVLDFFLSATTVETLGAILVAAELHRKLYRVDFKDPVHFGFAQHWFIAPVIPASLY